MLEGDFEPAYTITVTKPVQGIYTQNWFGDTIDGFYLHGCGYVNGDNRYLAKQKLDDADIHMILAGATGQGKSVTLNSIILTACSEYAPWELNLTMCDAKIFPGLRRMPQNSQCLTSGQLQLQEMQIT